MPIKLRLRNHLIISLGLLCSSLGWGGFLIPSQVTGGGASGLSALVFFISGIPAGVTYLIINTVLLLVASRILGKVFALKGVYGVIFFSVFLTLFQEFIHEPIVSDAFMATVLGSILVGTGTGIVISQGGSSGGTDIIAMIINKSRNISPGRVFVSVDVFIISCSFFVFRSVEKLVFGYCVMAISSYVVDLIISGSMQSYQILIFSRQYETIASRLSTEVRRGVSLLHGEGWYTHEKIKVIMIIIRKHEVSLVLKIVKETDPKAFLSMGQVMGVYGEGFESIKKT